MQEHIEYSVGSDDGKSITIKEVKTDFTGISFNIKFKYIGIVILLVVCCFFCGKYLKRVGVIDKISFDNSTHNKSFFCENGFVFKDSNTNVISREEILSLQDVEEFTFQRLLRMAINEIYARKGQIFNQGEVNDNYYRQYEWYNSTDKHEVEWAEFNEQEKENLRLLIMIEKEYGYR